MKKLSFEQLEQLEKKGYGTLIRVGELKERVNGDDDYICVTDGGSCYTIEELESKLEKGLNALQEKVVESYLDFKAEIDSPMFNGKFWQQFLDELEYTEEEKVEVNLSLKNKGVDINDDNYFDGNLQWYSEKELLKEALEDEGYQHYDLVNVVLDYLREKNVADIRDEFFNWEDYLVARYNGTNEIIDKLHNELLDREETDLYIDLFNLRVLSDKEIIDLVREELYC